MTAVLETPSLVEEFDAVIGQAEALCRLSLERTMFTPSEVLDLMIDMRSLLVKAREVVATPPLV